MGDTDGLFGPDTITWRVNREAVLLLGGGRALLLQVAHPLVAAGVEQHSRYATHPWRRLYETLDVTTRIVFGDAAESARASGRLRHRHDPVHGTAADGTPYDARDPDLLLWVWATLVETALLVHDRCLTPLTGDERERYYAEQTRFAVACGVPEGHWPATWERFAAWYAHTCSHELTVSEDARAVARSVVRPGPLFAPVNLLTAGLLPPGLREAYGLEWGPRRERLLDAVLGAVRHALPLVPHALRDFPAATAARRRAQRSRR